MPSDTVELVNPASPAPATMPAIIVTPEPVVIPAPAPIVTIASETAIQAAPVVQAPVVEAVKPTVPEPVVAPIEPKAPETLLGDDSAAVAVVVPGAKPITSEGGQSDEPAPPPDVVEKAIQPEAVVLPTYEPFQLPEGVSLDVAKVSKFTDLLSDLEVTNKGMDHALVQQFGQKAVDFHINEMKQTVDNINKLQQESWKKTQNDWKEQFLKDPEIGGNRYKTTIDAANKFIRTHGGSTEEQASFRNLMETSGLGNHPIMIRILAKAGAAMTEGTPLAASKPVAEAKSKTATLYGKRN